MFKMGCSMAKKILAIDGKSGAASSSTSADSGSGSKKGKDKQQAEFQAPQGGKTKTSGDELNDFSKLEADPRIPLNVRQIFKITKSWKAIARTMSKTGTAMFLNLFEQNEDLFYLFQRFQHLKGTDLHESMELREHASTVMATLDQSINSLSDYDNFVTYLHSIGKLHRKVPGFRRDHFWKIEQPFLKAVKQTLDERCNETIEEIYKIAIKLIIETIADGYGEDSPSKSAQEESEDNDGKAGSGASKQQAPSNGGRGGGGGGSAAVAPSWLEHGNRNTKNGPSNNDQYCFRLATSMELCTDQLNAHCYSTDRQKFSCETGSERAQPTNGAKSARCVVANGEYSTDGNQQGAEPLSVSKLEKSIAHSELDEIERLRIGSDRDSNRERGGGGGVKGKRRCEKSLLVAGKQEVLVDDTDREVSLLHLNEQAITAKMRVLEANTSDGAIAREEKDNERAKQAQVEIANGARLRDTLLVLRELLLLVTEKRNTADEQSGSGERANKSTKSTKRRQRVMLTIGNKKKMPTTTMATCLPMEKVKRNFSLQTCRYNERDKRNENETAANIDATRLSVSPGALSEFPVLQQSDSTIIGGLNASGDRLRSNTTTSLSSTTTSKEPMRSAKSTWRECSGCGALKSLAGRQCELGLHADRKVAPDDSQRGGRKSSRVAYSSQLSLTSSSSSSSFSLSSQMPVGLNSRPASLKHCQPARVEVDFTSVSGTTKSAESGNRDEEMMGSIYLAEIGQNLALNSPPTSVNSTRSLLEASSGLCFGPPEEVSEPALLAGCPRRSQVVERQNVELEADGSEPSPTTEASCRRLVASSRPSAALGTLSRYTGAPAATCSEGLKGFVKALNGSIEEIDSNEITTRDNGATVSALQREASSEEGDDWLSEHIGIEQRRQQQTSRGQRGYQQQQQQLDESLSAQAGQIKQLSSSSSLFSGNEQNRSHCCCANNGNEVMQLGKGFNRPESSSSLRSSAKIKTTKEEAEGKKKEKEKKKKELMMMKNRRSQFNWTDWMSKTNRMSKRGNSSNGDISCSKMLANSSPPTPILANSNSNSNTNTNTNTNILSKGKRGKFSLTSDLNDLAELIKMLMLTLASHTDTPKNDNLAVGATTTSTTTTNSTTNTTITLL